MDDVLQESALVGLNRFASFQRGSHFGAWMAQIVRHVSLNQARKSARSRTEVEVEAVADSLQDRPAAMPPAYDSRGELKDHQVHFDDSLDAGLRTLTPDARASLLLHVVEGMQQAEIGQLLGLPVGTVASHVHRARTALREHLSPNSSICSSTECQEVRDDAQEPAR